MENGFVGAQLSNELLKPRILFENLLQLPNLIALKPGILLLPSVKGPFGDPGMANQLRYGHSNVR